MPNAGLVGPWRVGHPMVRSARPGVRRWRAM